MNDLISVIVPIYNSEKYLNKCLKSIISQTYKNLEIILINDGSKDHSLLICNKYAGKDNRIKVIDKKNSGVSGSRNKGIETANGKYLFFVDSDDWIPSDSIEILYNRLIETDTDFVVGECLGINERSDTVICHWERKTYGKKNAAQYVDFINNLDWAPWGKLYKTDIIKNKKILFSPEIKYLEDSIFLAEYMSYCDGYATIDRIIYNYNKLNDNAATKKKYDSFYLWVLKFIEQYNKLFLSINDDYVKANINRFCVMRCFGACQYYATNYGDNIENENMVFEAFKSLSGYCELDATWPNNSDYEIKRRDCLKLLKQNDYEGFLKEVESFKMKPDLIKNIVTKLLGKLKKILLFGI